MEKISVACAMDWSIELDKGLRSKRPGHAVMAIEHIGPKLQRWSRELSITRGISNMYDMVPGEDRMFANTILLRLAEAFRSGDRQIRAAIIKIFLLELKDIFMEGRKYDGILAKRRVSNYLELLKRVKIVYDTGDVKARAISLRLFGCWADLTKDNADVRYLVLSSLQSCHVLEVKASLFAAGCMCRLSEDFSCIILGIVTDILCSKVSSDVKMGAACAFRKMQCSSFIVNRAYKAGKKLLSDFLSDEVASEMLRSLSTLALKSIILISEQVNFLLSFLCCEYASVVKATALKCLSFLILGGGHRFIDWNAVDILFHKIDDAELPVNLQCDVLSILHKIFCSSLQKPALLDTPEFFKLVSIVVVVAKSPIMYKRCLALHLLVDISCQFKRKNPKELSVACFLSTESSDVLELTSDKNGSLVFAHHVSMLIIDTIVSLVNHVDIGPASMRASRLCSTAPEVKQGCQHLLSLVLRLVGEYPELCPTLLTRISSFIRDLVYPFDEECRIVEASQKDMHLQRLHSFPVLPEAYRKNNRLEIVLPICKFVNACLTILDHVNAATSEVCHIVKLFTDCIRESRFHDCFSFEIFSLHLQSCIIWNSSVIGTNTRHDSNNSKVGVEPRTSHNAHWVQNEYLALEFAKEMLKRRNNWAVYKAGKYSACRGLWLAATYSFRRLVDQVKSDSCSLWLRSLMLLAGAESEIKMLLFPDLSISLINWLSTNNSCGKLSEVGDEVRRTVDGIADLRDSGGKLMRIYNRIRSSEEMLAALGGLNDEFCFQRWFLSLRAGVLEVLVDALGLLDSVSTDLSFRSPENLHNLAFHLTSISLRIKKLVKEFDLLATSFMDMDNSSSKSISRFALNCSLLAFCTAFPLFSKLSTMGTSAFELPCLGMPSNSVLVQDLMERLLDIDNKSVIYLQKFISVSGDCREYSQSRTHISRLSHTDKATIEVCRFAISGFQCLHEKAKEGDSCENLNQFFKDGLQLLSDTITKWMDLSFRTPKYFFRTRPCISAELFIFNADSKRPTNMSVSPGTKLSLNLSVQLRNASPGIFRNITKMYCILSARPSDCLSVHGREKQEIGGFQAWETGVLVDLNEKLMLFMNDGDTEDTTMNASGTDNGNDWVTTCVCFEPNENGQGFSACLLDVSTFPEGAYPIKWHSSCIGRDGFCWNLLPVNTPLFAIDKSCKAI